MSRLPVLLALAMVALLLGATPMRAGPADLLRGGSEPLPAFTPAVPANAPMETAANDIRVQVVAEQQTVIGAPMAGRLSGFPLRDGDRFDKGTTLARFHCAMQDAALARAHAVVTEKRRVLETHQKLRKLGTGSGLELGVAEAQFEEAQAAAAGAKAAVDNCVVIAPFAGRVAAVMVHEQQYVAESAPLLEILSDRTLELQMIVPSRWLAWLAPGAAFTVEIAETGKRYPAALTRISGKVDAVSQSIKVYGKLAAAVPGKADELLPGMTGRALFTPPTAMR